MSLLELSLLERINRIVCRVDKIIVSIQQMFLMQTTNQDPRYLHFSHFHFLAVAVQIGAVR